MKEQSKQKLSGHIFGLYRLKASCHMSPTQVDFSSMNANKNTQNSLHITPKFNRDSLYYTPSFLIPVDQNYYKSNRMYLQNQFQNKVNANKIRQTQIPSTAAEPHSNYCQICSTLFQNYQQHTNLSSHLKKCKQSLANDLIQFQCDKFSKKNIELERKISSEQILNDKNTKKNKRIKKNRKNNKRILIDSQNLDQAENVTIKLTTNSTDIREELQEQIDKNKNLIK